MDDKWELRVRDSDPFKRGFLISMQEFLSRIEQIDPDLLATPLTLRPHAEASFGAVASEYADRAEGAVVPRELLAALVDGTAEFCDATFAGEKADFEFGVDDASFYFVRGERNRVARIASAFENTELVAASG